MNKINLIIGREYWTRVKSKTFLVTTFLAPIGTLLFIGLVVFLMSRGSDNQKTIEIIDHGNIAEEVPDNRGNLIFNRSDRSLDELIISYTNEEIDGILELPAIDPNRGEYQIIYHSDQPLAIDESLIIERLFNTKIENFKVLAFGMDKEQLAKIETDISIEPQTINKKDKEISSITSQVTSVLGGAVGYLLFIVLITFGTQVMKGVNEEKLNRIVEVLISSVKPFDLMLGKVLGIGLVGLTQFAIWGVILLIGSFVASTFLGLGAADQIADNAMAQEVINNPETQKMIQNVFRELMNMNWALMIPLYFFYFFGGYLIYASLFAAVGAAAGDDVNDASAMTMVVMMPLMVAIYMGFSAVRAPHSSMAIWGSIIPFTAPILMPVRLGAEPPIWQIIASVLICIIFIVFMIWLTSRIYRIGILMYGKKASFKQLGKWLFTNN